MIFLSANSVQAADWPLRISSNGAYLEDQKGVPFLVVGEAAWSIAAELNPSEINTYLDNRQAKGFTAVMVNAIEHRFASNAPCNYDNQHPFLNGNFDWSIRNDKYWRHLDRVLNEAKKRNILVLLFPAYIGYGCGVDGWCLEMQCQTNAAMAEYGEWLGSRYRNQGNIVWVHGGDANANSYAGAMERVAAIAEGIRTRDAQHLHTAHSAPERSAQDDYPGIIDLNTTYSYKDPQARVQYDFQRKGALPITYIEGYYENEHGSKPIDWQRQALSAYLGGALLGHFFGNCPMWHFGGFPKWCNSSEWQAQLESVGSKSMAHIGMLMKSREWWKFGPDYSNAIVTSGKGAGAGYKAAARTTDGKTIMVWFPDKSRARINLFRLDGDEATAYWWNPNNNTSTAIANISGIKSMEFNPPGAGMVLVIDNAASGFAAPGLPRSGESLDPGGGGGCFIKTLELQPLL